MKDDAEETKPSKENNETVVKSTWPQGRYKRRERGKLVQAYSSKDLEGMLVKKAEESPATNCDRDFVSELVEALEKNVVKDIPPDWWGYKYGFVSRGLLGAHSRKKKSVPTEHVQNFHERAAFHEDQNKATTGKQELGIRDRPRKIAGCLFQEKKTSFGDSDGENSADSSSSLKRSWRVIKAETAKSSY